MTTTASADWCETYGTLTISGTRSTEHSRKSMGIKWCFHCRKRHEFFDVLMVPDGMSYYDPYWRVEGIARDCTDLFPGWTRDWDEC